MTININSLLAERELTLEYVQKHACLTTVRRWQALQGFIHGKKAREIAADMGITSAMVVEHARKALRDIATNAAYRTNSTRPKWELLTEREESSCV